LSVVLNAMQSRYEQIPAVRVYIKAFEVKTIDDFKSVLETLEVALEPDPLEVASSNKDRLAKAIRKVETIYRVWLKKGEANSSQRTEVPKHRPDDSYLREWTEADLLKRATEVIGDQVFRRAVTDCVSIDEMLVKIDLSPDDVERAIDRDGRETRKEHRTFMIAGKPFEVGGVETYCDLYNRLKEKLEKSSGPLADINDFGGIVKQVPFPVGDPKPVEQPRVKTSHLHSSPFKSEVVGIVGEIHAFLYLQSKFENITVDAWVSEFRTKVLPLPEY